MTTHTLEPVPALPAHAPRPLSGFIFLLILILILGLSVASQFPRWVASADAPAGDFSAQRAETHLAVIAREPHPAGSAAQAALHAYLVDQLASLNLKPETQPFGAYENIIARLPGVDSTGAIVVLAHCDSVPGAPGAADNGSGVAALLETARALTSSPPLRNDVIILFDDAEEVYPFFQGARAFVQAHPWMADVRMAISLDTAVAGPIQINDTGAPNGRLVHALAAAHRGSWSWFSTGGDGRYDNLPFKEAGVQSLDLEDNYAFRVQHTPLDRVEIVQAASLQQLGDQTLAITRELGGIDLRLPWGAQETFMYVPLLGLVHYPQVWTFPLGAIAGALTLAALAFALRRRAAAGRGLGLGFAAVLIAMTLAAVIVAAVWSQVPRLLSWQVSDWPEWPEIVPPHAGWFLAGFALLSLAIAAGLYRLARRWGTRTDMALAALVPFALLAVLFALAEPRLALLPVWPVLLGSLAWLAFLGIARLRRASLDLPAWITAALSVVHWPAAFFTIFFSAGPNDLPLIMALWTALVFVLLPALEGVVVGVRRADVQAQPA